MSECPKDIFTKICEEPINAHLMERYFPWGPDDDDEDPAFLMILSFITDELKLAASVLQDFAANIWTRTKEQDSDEQRKRERFQSMFNLIEDKALDLDALYDFARATLHHDPIVKRAVLQAGAAPRSDAENGKAPLAQ